MLQKIKNFILKNRYNLLLIFIFSIGIFIRIFNIQNYPNALNVDEASAGYEAYSILNSGTDRNGNFLPVYLVAWGSGQNALLSYLMIPFIQLFGLNTLSIRLPMAIIGCISLLFFIKRNKRQKISHNRPGIFGYLSMAYHEKQMGIRIKFISRFYIIFYLFLNFRFKI